MVSAKALIFFACLIILLLLACLINLLLFCERQNWTEQHIFGNVNKQHNGSLSLFRYTFPTMFKCWSVVLCGVKKLAYVLADKYFFFFFFAADTDLNLK